MSKSVLPKTEFSQNLSSNNDHEDALSRMKKLGLVTFLLIPINFAARDQWLIRDGILISEGFGVDFWGPINRQQEDFV